MQILGAEKALFRALKTKKETPKYGLLYHAQLVGQAPGKYKGRIARALASKAALAVRCDALGEDGTDDGIGISGREKVRFNCCVCALAGCALSLFGPFWRVCDESGLEKSVDTVEEKGMWEKYKKCKMCKTRSAWTGGASMHTRGRVHDAGWRCL